MDKISCEMCMDLMPLVRDGAASEDSRRAVERHLEECEACRELYEGHIPASDGGKALSKAVKRVKTMGYVALGAVVLMGICLCEMIMQGSSMLFVLAVLVIRSLLRVVFSREKGKVVKKTAALLGAVALTVGILLMGNTLYGNPVSKAMAKTGAENYLKGKFPESDYYVEDIWFDAIRGRYEVRIGSEGDAEISFSVDMRMDGTVSHDDYESQVVDRSWMGE